MREQRSSGCGIVGFLAIIAVIIVGMFAGGWMYLQQTETETHIVIDKDKVKSDTSKAVESGKNIIDSAAQGIENATQEPEKEVEVPGEVVQDPNAT